MDFAQGIIGVILFMLVAVVIIFWILFPLLVINKLGKIERLLTEISYNSDATAENTKRPKSAEGN